MISSLIDIFFKLIFLIILIVCVLSWIPILDRTKKPYIILMKVYKAIMAPFSFIPPIGMIDITPIIAFFVYGIIARLILQILVSLGL